MQGVVVYEVAMKPGWESNKEAELDMIVGWAKDDPDFVKGWWFSDGTTGYAVHVVVDEAAAQRAAAGAAMPDDASVSLVSAKAFVLEREA